jgi:hypothetical protein
MTQHYKIEKKSLATTSIAFLVSFKSSRGGVHQLGFMVFGLAV